MYTTTSMVCLTSRTSVRVRTEIKWCSAHWAGTLIGAAEPLEQTVGVEFVVARLARLLWHSLVIRDDKVANGARSLVLHESGGIVSERSQTGVDGTILQQC